MPRSPVATTPPRQPGLFDDEPAPSRGHAAMPPPADAGEPLRHPRAQREIVFGQHRVGYELRRARRRSIGFVVSADGLSVSAPRWVALHDVEQALHEKSAWILRKLHEQRDRSRRLAEGRIEWRDGATLPFLGRPVQLVLDASAVGAVLDASGDTPRLRLGLSAAASATQIRDAAQSWLQRQARRIFDERIAEFAPRLGVRVSRVSLSSATTRWGSASASGAIRLNWRLVHFALPVIDYVVTHELAHLREMNHSPAFWDVVRSVLPDYEAARSTLRRELAPALD
jgi:predicted metal-dependent hydrolase